MLTPMETNTQELYNILNTVNTLPTATSGGNAAQDDLLLYLSIYADSGRNMDYNSYSLFVRQGTVQEILSKFSATSFPNNVRVGIVCVVFYGGAEFRQYIRPDIIQKVIYSDGSAYLDLRFRGNYWGQEMWTLSIPEDVGYGNSSGIECTLTRL